MNPGDFQALIAAGESLTLEFKSSFDKATIETLVADYPEIAFAPEEKFGGILVAFVREAGKAEGVSGGVSGGVSELLELLSVHPGLNATELVIRLNKPKRTIERWLRQLKAEGKVEFRGAPKTGGYHVIK